MQTWVLTRGIGDMVWTGRSIEPQELAQVQEVDRDDPGFVLHLYITRLVHHASASSPDPL